MVLFTIDVKKIKGAAHKNDGVDSMFKRAFTHPWTKNHAYAPLLSHTIKTFIHAYLSVDTWQQSQGTASLYQKNSLYTKLQGG